MGLLDFLNNIITEIQALLDVIPDSVGAVLGIVGTAIIIVALKRAVLT